MNAPTKDLTEDVRRIEGFLTSYLLKEEELLSSGDKFLKDVRDQTALLASKTAGSDPTTALIVGGIGLAVSLVGKFYVNREAKLLEKERVEFARKNADKLEELGHLLNKHIKIELAVIEAQDNRMLFLDPHSWPVYESHLRQNIRFFRAFMTLIGRRYIFMANYINVWDWAGRKTNEELLTPPVPDEWFRRRTEGVLKATQNSRSFMYNFSLQGHIFLFMPKVESIPAIGEFHERTATQIKKELQALSLANRTKYIEKATDIFQGSALTTFFDIQNQKNDLKITAKKTVPWVLSGVAGVIGIILFIVVLIIIVFFALIQAVCG